MILSRFCCAIFSLTLAALVFRPIHCWAWGNEGHRVIALVADRLLQTGDPAAQRKLAEILATDTSNDWTKKDVAGEATWADALREKSPEGRAATAKWHYVKFAAENPDLKKACFGRPALPALTPASHAPQDNCIVDKIEQFAKELRDPATLPGERLMAVQFLLNLVGDIHDPLYTIERNDQGGRCVAVVPPGANTPVRLSDYWDETLVAQAEGKDPLKAGAQIAAGLTAGEIEKWSGGAPDEWAQESYNVAKAAVYNFPSTAASGKVSLPAAKGEKNACGPIDLYKLDNGYRDRAIAAVKQQLTKAGLRLAMLLRESLN